MKTNQEYKNLALSKLKGNWKPAVIVSLVYLLITLVFSFITSKLGDSVVAMIISAIIQVVILLPLGVGFYNSFKLMLLNDDYNLLPNMVDLATTDFKRSILGMLFMSIKVILWSLLLIIPGLIKSYAYMLTPYILKDMPQISAREASSLSDEMMKGHKFDLFYLHLSFIGWIILSIVSCGIGFLWLQPYMLTAQAAFYEDVKIEYANRNQAAQ